MEFKSIKDSFYNYLNELNENKILILMNYLSLLVQDFNSDYTKFKGLLFILSFKINLNKFKSHYLKRS